MTTVTQTFDNLRGHVGRSLGRPLSLAVAGAGARGTGYAALAAAGETPVAFTAVAEPRDARRRASCNVTSTASARRGASANSRQSANRWPSGTPCCPGPAGP